jgi:hypothetical protein
MKELGLRLGWEDAKSSSRNKNFPGSGKAVVTSLILFVFLAVIAKEDASPHAHTLYLQMLD